MSGKEYCYKRIWVSKYKRWGVCLKKKGHWSACKGK